MKRHLKNFAYLIATAMVLLPLLYFVWSFAITPSGVDGASYAIIGLILAVFATLVWAILLAIVAAVSAPLIAIGIRLCKRRAN